MNPALISFRILAHSSLISGGVEGADYQRETEEKDAAAAEENIQGESQISTNRTSLGKVMTSTYPWVLPGG